MIFLDYFLEINSSEWDVDQSRLNRLKEEYKRDRHGKQQQQHQSTISSSMRNNLLDNGNDDISADQRTFSDDEQSIFYS